MYDVLCVEVESLSELPNETCEGKKFFSCIGGKKNFQCFLAESFLSKGEFLVKYSRFLDKCLYPVYEDTDIVVRQDAKKAIPGFYIVATKKHYHQIAEMPFELFSKCYSFAYSIKQWIKENTKNELFDVFIYYDEHYLKPSSVHFWVLPIYTSHIKKFGSKPSIVNSDIWTYQDLFNYVNYKEEIVSLNELFRKTFVPPL